MKNNKKHRIVVIGLDSCDPDLILRWSKEGHIPHITSMLESGVWARLMSTRNLFDDSPWPSFNTGVNPAKHAFYDFQQLKRGTTEIIRADARHCRYFPFWWLLRNAGKKVAVFDVPKTYPIEGIDGIQISAWGEHYPLLKRSSLPLPIAEELNFRFGKYRHPKEIIEPRRISQEMRLYKTMISGIDNKLGASIYVMDQEDWDLYISVFSESHYGGHQFFHYSDERHWAFDSRKASLIGEPLPHIYSQIDSAIDELFRRVPDEATFFIVSVHGIETNYSANHLVPTILEGLGFQIPPSDGDSSLGSIGRKNWAHSLRDLLPESFREFINDKILPQSVQDRLFSRLFSTSIDWKKTKAFFLPSDHFQVL